MSYFSRFFNKLLFSQVFRVFLWSDVYEKKLRFKINFYRENIIIRFHLLIGFLASLPFVRIRFRLGWLGHNVSILWLGLQK